MALYAFCHAAVHIMLDMVVKGLMASWYFRERERDREIEREREGELYQVQTQNKFYWVV